MESLGPDDMNHGVTSQAPLRPSVPVRFARPPAVARRATALYLLSRLAQAREAAGARRLAQRAKPKLACPARSLSARHAVSARHAPAGPAPPSAAHGPLGTDLYLRSAQALAACFGTEEGEGDVAAARSLARRLQHQSRGKTKLRLNLGGAGLVPPGPVRPAALPVVPPTVLPREVQTTPSAMSPVGELQAFGDHMQVAVAQGGEPSSMQFPGHPQVLQPQLWQYQAPGQYMPQHQGLPQPVHQHVPLHQQAPAQNPPPEQPPAHVPALPPHSPDFWENI